MTNRTALALVALAACSGTSSRQHVSFAKLSFEMPDDWSGKESIRRGTSTTIWTPESNDRHESVTVIRTELATAVAHAGSPTLDGILSNAAAGLPGAKSSRVEPLLTRSGLSGVRVDVDYVPPGQRERYHRVHIVLLARDQRSLVHLLYTAKTPDDDLSVLNTVLATIREGEG